MSGAAPTHAAGREERRRWTPWRRTVQAAVALAFLALPFVTGPDGDRLTTVHGTLASFAVGPVEVTEPTGGLSAMVAAMGATGPGGVGLAAVAGLALAILPWVAVGLVLGPVFCSWVCPWGLASELLDRLRFRKGSRRIWSPDGFRRLRWPRLGLFVAVLAAGAVLALPMAALVSPPRWTTVLPLELAVLGTVSTVTAGLLLGLLALELAGTRRTGRRLWCRALCPVGTGFKLVRLPRRFAPLGIRWHEPACTCPGVPACQTHCAWGIDPRRMTTFDGCTHCFACVDGCPTGALAVGPARGGDP